MLAQVTRVSVSLLLPTMLTVCGCTCVQLLGLELADATPNWYDPAYCATHPRPDLRQGRILALCVARRTRDHSQSRAAIRSISIVQRLNSNI